MWIKCISVIEHLVSIEMKKKSFEVPESFIDEDFSERFLFRQLIKQQLILVLHWLFYCNQKTKLEMKYSYSGGPKSLQENNKTHDKSVLLGRNNFYIGFVEWNLA